MTKLPHQPHVAKSQVKLNSMRAAILGANDGIVSVAGIVVGVAGASTSRSAVFTAGAAGLVAGAISMAAGEYTSVSSQRDTEKALLEKEKRQLRDYPEEESRELERIYTSKGLSKETAKKVVAELSNYDALRTHAEVALKIDMDDLNSPWRAATSSALSFLCGAIIPILAITLSPEDHRIPMTFVAVLLALCLTGYLSAKASGANRFKATLRVVIGGAIAMVITYFIGKLIGTHIS